MDNTMNKQIEDLTTEELLYEFEQRVKERHYNPNYRGLSEYPYRELKAELEERLNMTKVKR
jgi:hypothetical protein